MNINKNLVVNDTLGILQFDSDGINISIPGLQFELVIVRADDSRIVVVPSGVGTNTIQYSITDESVLSVAGNYQCQPIVKNGNYIYHLDIESFKVNRGL